MSKGLEALQDLSKMVFIYGGVEQYKIIEKELKALEIIKEKKVNPYIDVCCYNNYKHYLEEYEYFNNKLTQEEFNLLKEVML